MHRNSRIQQYLELRKKDPEAAARFREEHAADEVFAAEVAFADTLLDSIREGQAKARKPVEEHPLFPAVDLQQPRTACGDSREE